MSAHSERNGLGVDQESAATPLGQPQEPEPSRDATVCYTVNLTFETWVAHLLTVWGGFYRHAP